MLVWLMQADDKSQAVKYTAAVDVPDGKVLQVFEDSAVVQVKSILLYIDFIFCTRYIYQYHLTHFGTDMAHVCRYTTKTIFKSKMLPKKKRKHIY